MPEFAYHAIDRNGRTTDGTMIAEDESELERRLRDIDRWLVEARKVSTKRKVGKIKVPRRELIEFFTGGTSLLMSGIPVADMLVAMAEETTHPALKQVLEDVSLNVQTGEEISTSFRNYPSVFSEQVCNLIAAGEHGGNLTTTFEDLADHLEWVEGIMGDIKQASIYPAMIMLAVAGLVGLMFTFVVPRFAGIFVELNIPLPTLTRGVLAIGQFAESYWWAVLLSLAGAIVAARMARRTHPDIAYKIDEMKLKLPIIGNLQSMLLQSQFVHTLALMLKAGVPILDALNLSRGVGQSLVLDAAVADAVGTVQQGGRISEALREHPVISPLTLRMIVVGEDAGRLDTTLQQVADRYDKEVPRQIKRVFAVLEPAITLGLIVIVGLVAGALFLPMFTLMSGLR